VSRAPLTPEPLQLHHAVRGYTSGEPEIDAFLIEQAAREQTLGLSRTWVMARPDDRVMLGFVSLSAASQAVRIKVQGKKKPLISGPLARSPCPIP
jgi:hypothetical protein